MTYLERVLDPPDFLRGGDELTKPEYIFALIFSYAMKGEARLFKVVPSGLPQKVTQRIHEGLICGVRGRERCSDEEVEQAFVDLCVANYLNPGVLLIEWAEEENVVVEGKNGSI